MCVVDQVYTAGCCACWRACSVPYSCWLSCSARSPIHRIKLIPKYPVKSRRMRPFTKKLCVGLLLGDEKPWRVTSVQQCSARSEEHTSELQSRFDLVC